MYEIEAVAADATVFTLLPIPTRTPIGLMNTVPNLRVSSASLPVFVLLDY